MTPLAYRTLKDITLHPKKRWLLDKGDVASRMDGIHCFDLFEAASLVEEVWMLAKEEKNREMINVVASFLPAPRTWIEGNMDEWGRAAIHLEQIGDVAKATLVHSPSGGRSGKLDYISYPIGELKIGQFALRGNEESLSFIDNAQAFEDAKASGFVSEEEFFAAWHSLCHWGMSWASTALTIINSPKIVRRETHLPHKGLARRLKSHFGKGHPFQIRPWTEIKIEVSVPDKHSTDTGTVGEILTGRKALHFCRSHLRVRLGKLETVRSHWRGSATAGIVQSKYKVSKPDDPKTSLAIYR